MTSLIATAFLAALQSDAPSPEIAGNDLYAFLLGSWDAEVIDYDEAGARQTARGEWHFARVLEGRGVQDVWISPPRGDRGARTFANRYGTSIRVYDRKAQVWRVTWINPVSGAHDELTGRREGADVVQEGTAADGSRMRWVFTGIAPASCVWKGYGSSDGKTWRLEAEFHLRRHE
jgi:hypothetical protein